MTSSRVSKKLADYQPAGYQVTAFELTFELAPTDTRVTALSTVTRQTTGDLILDGQHLELISLRVNGQDWMNYSADAETLRLSGLPEKFSLEVVTKVSPETNTALEGLYLSDGAYCTQCEAEGFRRITYFLDRPDVMTVYTTHIIADPKFQHLLSNGNLIADTILADGRRKVSWYDPFPKPCYLFALVAGNFDEVLGSYRTQSGRDVKLAFYVDKGKAKEAEFALGALQRAMRFDEEVFGREYDLDIYMVVAVDFFNMGAMENKGLNIFNSKFVLAKPASATDTDYFNIESIIGHEYFHNWTGNRVTCRDWFQLSLKEGLTVFRDQQFSAMMGSPTLCRIDAVKTIRTAQFAEDAGPMAHAIRPEQVLEMNNFYTVTVYDKGAEVIRMQHTLLGELGFRKGMDLYFARHDGQAVTCDDFVQAMQDANDVDLSQFRRWYNQAGTPNLSVAIAHIDEGVTITMQQATDATADGSPKLPFHIPVGIELIDPVTKRHGSFLLELIEAEQTFVFEGWGTQTVPVILTNFSAPVKLVYPQPVDTLLFIAANAKDGFARWDAMQQLWASIIRDSIVNKVPATLPAPLISTLRQLLNEPGADQAFAAEMLSLPSFDNLAEQYAIIPVDELLSALRSLSEQIASSLKDELQACYQRLKLPAYCYEPVQVGVRALRNQCLSYMCYLPDVAIELLQLQCTDSDNMTDVMSALQALVRAGHPSANDFLENFLRSLGDNVQLFDKHSNLVASLQGPQVFAAIEQTNQHRLFSWQNPNRVRALYSAFAQLNPLMFHQIDGSGYQLIAQAVAKADRINPQLAARMITPLLAWRRFDNVRANLMRNQLAELSNSIGLSNDVFEKVSRGLA